MTIKELQDAIKEEIYSSYECEIAYIILTGSGCEADCTNTISFDADSWEKLIFPTREAAEKRLEMNKEVQM